MSTRAQQDNEGGFDRGRRIVAVVSILVLVGAVLILSFSDRTDRPMAINGDQLGQDSSEAVSEYRERAGISLEQAPTEEPAYALVTFTEALPATRAGDLLAEIRRVNAMIMLSAPAMALPEPVAGQSRAEVFERQFDQVERSLGGIGAVGLDRELNAVVVRDTGGALRTLAQSPEVFSVEVLPPDAAWGAFGIRPVYPDGATR